MLLRPRRTITSVFGLIDTPKELYRWRLRIRKAIAWTYLNDCVPVMMTLTIFHRWNNLDGLLRVLQKSWDNFLVSSWSARKRRAAMDLQGYVRRLEITINDGLITPDGEVLLNAGCWLASALPRHSVCAEG